MKIVFMNQGVSLEFSENVASKSNKNEKTLEGIGGFSKLEKMSLTVLATVNLEGKTYEATLHRLEAQSVLIKSMFLSTATFSKLTRISKTKVPNSPPSEHQIT